MPALWSPRRKAQALVDWYSRNARDLPWRRNYDPYSVWISEMMLQQTQVQTVIPYFEKWMRRFPTIKTLARSEIDEVLKHWAGLGYYRRARFVHEAARAVAENRGGDFPSSFDEIMQLPGVGRYSAGAISSIAFDRPSAILDGNVIRVLSRATGLRGDVKKSESLERLWQAAEELVTAADRLGPRRPKRACASLNQALMELGAIVCTPREPRCEVCPLRECCIACKKGLTHVIPATPKRIPATKRYWAAFIIRKESSVLLRRRDDSEVNGGLWEFPNIELAREACPYEGAARLLGIRPQGLAAAGQFTHAITRYRNRVEVFTWAGAAPAREGDFLWVRADRLMDLPFPSAHRKIARISQAFA